MTDDPPTEVRNARTALIILRWIAVIVGMVTASVATWVLAKAVSSVIDHEKRITALETHETDRWAEVLRRLNSIEVKLDKRKD